MATLGSRHWYSKSALQCGNVYEPVERTFDRPRLHNRPPEDPRYPMSNSMARWKKGIAFMSCPMQPISLLSSAASQCSTTIAGAGLLGPPAPHHKFSGVKKPYSGALGCGEQKARTTGSIAPKCSRPS